jgi:opacity protein-like surface antigen
MQNVARGVGLSGLAALILACAMAAPAVAASVVNPTIVPIVKPTFRPNTPPAGGGIKTVRPPQNNKSNLGRPPSVKADRLNSNSNPGGGTTTGGGGTVDVTVSDIHSPKLVDPALGLSLKGGVHSNQLDAVYCPGGCKINTEPNPGGGTVVHIISGVTFKVAAGSSWTVTNDPSGPGQTVVW